MNTPYQQFRTRLIDDVLAMASHAELALANATRSYVERDDTLARAVEDNDDTLDHFEIEIDEVAIHLLAMAPLATELRLITVAMKISQNLERIGDQAVSIARRALVLNAQPQLKDYIDLPRMAAIVREMLRAAIGAFVERLPAEARRVISHDIEVDQLNLQLHRELSSFMVERASTIPRCLELMEISRGIERIADHTTNIAEQIVYLCEARDIRHAANRTHDLENPRC